MFPVPASVGSAPVCSSHDNSARVPSGRARGGRGELQGPRAAGASESGGGLGWTGQEPASTSEAGLSLRMRMNASRLNAAEGAFIWRAHAGAVG